MDMKSISQQLQNDIRDILEGKVKHPNQQKIDVHEPEKDEITAKDFEMLRKGKKAVKEDSEENVVEDTELCEAEMPAADKRAAHEVHKVLKNGESVSIGYGTSIKAMHKVLKRKYGVDWRKKAGINEETEAKKPNPFDWKNNPSMLDKKPGEKAGFDSKKISTGTVYSKKPVKESYSFADYLDAARAKYGDADAVVKANEAFKNQDITLFADQSQSPEA
jgi:hypothetical protein